MSPEFGSHFSQNGSQWGFASSICPEGTRHALRKALGVIARQQGWELADVAQAAGAELLAASSLKAALDLDWDEPTARDEALQLVLTALLSVESWVETHTEEVSVTPRVADQVADSLAVAHQVCAQDV